MKEALQQIPEILKIPEFGELIIIPAINEHGCVDPRPADIINRTPKHPNIINSHHHEGALRTPGASMGYVMALATAIPEIPVEKVVTTINQWENSEGRVFTLHGDNHRHHTGCGHMDKALHKDHEALYGISSEKMANILNSMPAMLMNGVRIKRPILTGEHKEKGVLIVVSENKTVKPRNNNGEFFRYDSLRHEKSLERLAIFVNQKKIPVNTELLKQAAKKQLGATLALLAGGLPIFELDLRGENHIVRHQDHV